MHAPSSELRLPHSRHDRIPMFSYVLFLSLVVSLDALISGLTYGLKGMRLPIASLAIIGMVTVVCTSLALGGAHVAGWFVNPRTAAVAGATLLVLLGGYHLLLDYLTQDGSPELRSRSAAGRELKFSVGALLVDIMVKPEAADIDRSMDIGAMEAVFLGLALGLDNAVATLAASLGNHLPAYTPLVMGGVQTGLTAIGLCISRRVVINHLKLRLPYLSGAALVVLGLARVF
jgi:putative sporulation protein YtaF